MLSSHKHVQHENFLIYGILYYHDENERDITFIPSQSLIDRALETTASM